jgi:hypothetical protein
MELELHMYHVFGYVVSILWLINITYGMWCVQDSEDYYMEYVIFFVHISVVLTL